MTRLLTVACGVLLSFSATDPAKTLKGLSFPPEVQVAFVQRQLNPMLQTPQRQSGRLWIDAGAGLTMQVESPRRETRRLADGQLSLTRDRPGVRPGGKPTTTRRIALDATQPGHLVLLAVQALLSGDLAAVEQHFRLHTLPAEEGWRVCLVPREPQMQEALSRLLLQGTGDRLTQVRSEVDAADGSISAWVQIEIEPPPS